MAFSYLGIEIEFRGKGLDETAFVKSCSDDRYQIKKGVTILKIDKRYFRPTEVDLLIGNSQKAKDILGWEPEISLEELVNEMVESDIKLFSKEKYLKDLGISGKNYYE